MVGPARPRVGPELNELAIIEDGAMLVAAQTGALSGGNCGQAPMQSGPWNTPLTRTWIVARPVCSPAFGGVYFAISVVEPP